MNLLLSMMYIRTCTNKHYIILVDISCIYDYMYTHKLLTMCVHIHMITYTYIII